MPESASTMATVPPATGPGEQQLGAGEAVGAAVGCCRKLVGGDHPHRASRTDGLENCPYRCSQYRTTVVAGNRTGAEPTPNREQRADVDGLAVGTPLAHRRVDDRHDLGSHERVPYRLTWARKSGRSLDNTACHQLKTTGPVEPAHRWLIGEAALPRIIDHTDRPLV